MTRRWLDLFFEADFRFLEGLPREVVRRGCAEKIGTPRSFVVCSAMIACVLGTALICPRELLAQGEAGALALLVRALDSNDDAAIRSSLMRGMLRGLDGRRAVAPPDGWNKLSGELLDSEDKQVRELSLRLSQLFGDERATRLALATLQDQSAPVSGRQAALRSLLMQQNEELPAILAVLLDEPKMRLAAIRGFAAVQTADGPSLLLRRYDDWEPRYRRAVIETLATRKSYAEALLDAMKNKEISRDDVPAHVARSLSTILGEPFLEVYGDVRKLGQDRAKAMTRYKKMLTEEALARADASKGRAVFQKTCASCHLLYGTGGKIGPDLTGSNRANLDYILLNSVDPSYDVPEGYQMVLIQTLDGRLISGVIAEEDSNRVVLKTVEQPLVVIAKTDIEARKTSPKSMMPDGQLQQMKRQEVIDLIKYLQTTEQVEMKK